MLKSITESPLYPIVNPRSVVFFGASNRATAMGTSQLLSLRSLGYQGAVYPVHPKEITVQGLPAYRHIRDIPELPDLAVIVLAAPLACEAVEECAEAGMKSAIVIAGGFREAGPEGAALERRLVETAKTRGMRFLGPNCLGVANPHQHVNTTFLRYEGNPGFIGLASQSGSYVTQMFHYLSQFNLGFSTAFSVGNEANVDIVDCMEYLGACPHTRVIALYIEAIRRGREFVEVARSIVPHKPIVVYYAGGSEMGRRAGFSHTGAMAGPDRVYDGVFRQSGILRAQSMTELFDFSMALGNLPAPAGRRVMIQTHSGGPGAAAADACGRAGLTLPEISRDALEKLSPYIPPTGSTANPLDITYSKNAMDYFSKIPKILLADDAIDIFLFYILMPSDMVRASFLHMGVPSEEVEEKSESFLNNLSSYMAHLRDKYGKPVVGFTYRSFQDRFVAGLLEQGIPVYAGPERAIRAIQALVRYHEIKSRIRG